MSGPEQKIMRVGGLDINPYRNLTIISTSSIEKALQTNRRCALPTGSVVLLEGIIGDRTHINMGVLEIGEPLNVKLIGVGTNLPLKASPSVVVAAFDFDLNALQTEAITHLRRFGLKNSPPWVFKRTPIEIFFSWQEITVDLREEGFSPEQIEGLHVTSLLSQYPRFQEPASSVNTRFRR
ncbi:MAG: hypothetical protein US51_C0022G0003 [Microgenomates group bacterium GW2011_GWA2_37_6]|nr:MAG: hypothetical protein US51_C0022G0003 [Microgenomates group bacterium GW2011_GWA2_37_6]